MTRLLRVVRAGLYTLIAIAVVGGALVGYFIYTPAPEVPTLSGTLSRESFEFGGLTRTYRLYVPRGLPKGAPLVVVMHGSGENGVRIRLETGYAFDRLADTNQFAVAYPNAYTGDWNACGTVGDERTNGSGIDDVGFLSGLVNQLAVKVGIDPRRAFAVGSSRGGFMAFRLALEAPAQFRAVAAVSANVHTPDNFKCKPSPGGTSSVMIMNGTDDPLVPFGGGRVSLLGFSYKYGTVMSSLASGQYLAELNHIAVAPVVTETQTPSGVHVERVRWRSVESGVEVELVAVQGGGHGMPQPYRRHARLLGPSPKEPNGPAEIWAFFAGQPKR